MGGAVRKMGEVATKEKTRYDQGMRNFHEKTYC